MIFDQVRVMRRAKRDEEREERIEMEIVVDANGPVEDVEAKVWAAVAGFVAS